MANILVVDDEIEVAAAVRRVLERATYSVTTAHNATEALEALGEQHYDVVITDIIMPKVHGVELIKRLRQQYPRIRIIAISGGGSFGPLGYKPEAISTHAYLAAAREAGAEEILTKPFDLTDLIGAVRRLLPN